MVGSLFAGQINTGINAPWVLCYLAKHPRWLGEVRKEINAAADKHCGDTSLSLPDRLARVSLEGWEQAFPLVDLCIRDSIRIQSTGAGYRKNLAGRDLDLGNGEVVPKDYYLSYHFDDVLMDPNVYSDPYEWDPSRYFPDRAEDKKVPYAAVHWGAGRHPCLGMRFAKLEMTVIVAFFCATFDFELCDKDGNSTDKLPEPNRQAYSAHKPPTKIYLKYTRRV